MNMDKLNQQQLFEIAMQVYEKSEKSSAETVDAKEMIDEITQQIMMKIQNQR